MRRKKLGVLIAVNTAVTEHLVTHLADARRRHNLIGIRYRVRGVEGEEERKKGIQGSPCVIYVSVSPRFACKEERSGVSTSRKDLFPMR